VCVRELKELQRSGLWHISSLDPLETEWLFTYWLSDGCCSGAGCQLAGSVSALTCPFDASLPSIPASLRIFQCLDGWASKTDHSLEGSSLGSDYIHVILFNAAVYIGFPYGWTVTIGTDVTWSDAKCDPSSWEM